MTSIKVTRKPTTVQEITCELDPHHITHRTNKDTASLFLFDGKRYSHTLLPLEQLTPARDLIDAMIKELTND